MTVWDAADERQTEGPRMINNITNKRELLGKETHPGKERGSELEELLT